MRRTKLNIEPRMRMFYFLSFSSFKGQQSRRYTIPSD